MNLIFVLIHDLTLLSIKININGNISYINLQTIFMQNTNKYKPLNNGTPHLFIRPEFFFNIT